VNEHINPNRFTDSAGTPWEGRSFDQNSFADDDGKAPPELIQAISKFRAGEVGAEAVIGSDSGFQTSGTTSCKSW
jgi:hypothetical protein